MYCWLLGQCFEECKEVVKWFRSYLCMMGIMGEYVMWNVGNLKIFEELSFYLKVRLCDFEIL